MNDDELLRYSRHILLDAIGIEGQERFAHAHLLIVGAGGLGCAAGLYLGAAGVGRVTLVDDDRVDLTNLQRQIAHGTASVGSFKVDSLAASITAINPLVTIERRYERADAAWLEALLPTCDLVVDCCDNFATRQLVNAACVQAGKPLVSGAAIGFDGQLAIYDPAQADSPCYACVFPPTASVEEVACATMGVFAPLVGMIGTAQAALALQWLLAHGAPKYAQTMAASRGGTLRMLDGRSLEWSSMRIARDPGCPVCGGRHLNG
ncbi:molybdopterin-synthase adenylyltransferase MoeB [Xylophilus sp. GOD-11R]|uniref:HesA/MoeB/ThiF family protein n=1 Tax=Xylophilus sp. GOD-11R TaxID=3089814 RepID=UPI00298C9A3C|nr:molybdopterin-synthase adenylyltransferase MoeB [Xylophilus sp. GOD-11R]WPB56575.1 molybdopterin-synthase adenylyltransferase MoeB [Xylophilus sp. GOD-11R]